MSDRKPVPAAGGRYFRDKVTGALRRADKDDKPHGAMPAAKTPVKPIADTGRKSDRS